MGTNALGMTDGALAGTAAGIAVGILALIAAFMVYMIKFSTFCNPNGKSQVKVTKPSTSATKYESSESMAGASSV